MYVFVTIRKVLLLLVVKPIGYRKYLILHNINLKYLTLHKYINIFIKCLNKGKNVDVKERKLKTCF